jgi:hypothetical protein
MHYEFGRTSGRGRNNVAKLFAFHSSSYISRVFQWLHTSAWRQLVSLSFRDSPQDQKLEPLTHPLVYSLSPGQHHGLSPATQALPAFYGSKCQWEAAKHWAAADRNWDFPVYTKLRSPGGMPKTTGSFRETVLKTPPSFKLHAHSFLLTHPPLFVLWNFWNHQTTEGLTATA